ncbi:hypothetical protein G7Z17_g1652 [Cylindrodendrum hubeiense]|uniref:Uncharacterized protein n=1 Tax=Cylindrodendrum hubeiense TaxID=595255 RepID=A0A9P5HI36_9HYPO|nr:hypothetical protein G7Z17_g1652 [Cylindrodendrum hubeiense]
MHFSSILPVIAVVLGAANGAAIDDSLVEPRAPSCPVGIELLRLTGFPKNPDGVFTGIGIPGKCQNLPSNINTFDKAEALNGFQCIIYTQKDCQGSTFTVGGGGNKAFKGQVPKWRSFRCACRKC